MLSKSRIGRTAIALGARRILDEADDRQLTRAIELSRHFQAQLPQDILASAGLRFGDEARVLNATCRFAHVGLLVFPSSAAAAASSLDDRGLAPAPLIPSVVVRRRLAQRYRIDQQQCNVGVTRLQIPVTPFGNALPIVEVFLFGRDSLALTDNIISTERNYGFEEHIAFSVRRPTTDSLNGLFEGLVRGGFVWEGGGYNHNEGLKGSTIFYFIAAGNHTLIPRRFELHADGDFRSVLDRHPVDAALISEQYDEWVMNGRHS
jgi:hypothetical protein